MIFITFMGDRPRKVVAMSVFYPRGIEHFYCEDGSQFMALNGTVVARIK